MADTFWLNDNDEFLVDENGDFYFDETCCCDSDPCASGGLCANYLTQSVETTLVVASDQGCGNCTGFSKTYTLTGTTDTNWCPPPIVSTAECTWRHTNGFGPGCDFQERVQLCIDCHLNRAAARVNWGDGFAGQSRIWVRIDGPFQMPITFAAGDISEDLTVGVYCGVPDSITFDVV